MGFVDGLVLGVKCSCPTLVRILDYLVHISGSGNLLEFVRMSRELGGATGWEVVRNEFALAQRLECGGISWSLLEFVGLSWS